MPCRSLPCTPDSEKWNCDLMSVSGHKIGAPKGIGALYVKKGLRLPPLTFGRRSGARHTPGHRGRAEYCRICQACEIRMAHFDEDYAHVQELADYLCVERSAMSAELSKLRGMGSWITGK